ncbi:FecR domain-containing protein [Candidatus Peregrinibacteria bacterium]|nr:FecR domain-containing protein [Candidatus Peregrinibacteria bacterium]
MKFLKHRTTQILLAVIIILLVVFLAMLLTRRGGVREEPTPGLFISWMEGEVLFSGNGEIWEMADSGVLLTNGYRLRTGKDAKAILTTPRGSSVRLSENTEVQVAQVNEQDVLLIQNSGRTYHRVKMADEDVYQVRALNHTIKAVGTAFDISTNRKANRVNIKVLEGKINVAVHLDQLIEVQSIGKGKEITIDPESQDSMVALADVSREYAESDWMTWNRQEDIKIGYVINSIEELLEEEGEETPSTTTAAPSSNATTKTPTPSTPPPSAGTCQPYLTGKKDSTYKAIILNWSTCSSEDFQFYKVVRSTLNPNPSYPADPVITSSSNRNYSNYIDKTVAPSRTYYYRVCVVQRLNKISCGNKISVTY